MHVIVLFIFWNYLLSHLYLSESEFSASVLGWLVWSSAVFCVTIFIIEKPAYEKEMRVARSWAFVRFIAKIQCLGISSNCKFC